MTPYSIASIAHSDLDGIYDYIAARNRPAAIRVIAGLHERFSLLSTQPLLGEECPEIMEGLRRISSGNYVVYYRIVHDRIRVMRVLHGARGMHGML